MDDLATAPSRAPSAPQEQVCVRCCGRGSVTYGYVRFTTYPCSICKGTGKVTDARLKRVAGAKKAAVSREQNLSSKKEAFKAANASAYAWMVKASERGDSFATSLLDGFTTYGGLTEKQLNAVNNAIARSATRQQERVEVAPTLGEGALKLVESLQNASARGLGRPKMRTEHFDFALAPKAGNNAGFVYVKSTETGDYLGKIAPTGKFMGFRCSPEMMATLAEVCQDPLGAAVKFGRLTGSCSCCGRKLDNKLSVELGIGPVCRDKYF